MIRLFRVLVFVAAAFAAPTASAQQPPPPAGLSQQQFDQLLEALTKAAREQMAREAGGKPAKPAAPSDAAEVPGDGTPLGRMRASGAFDSFLGVIATAPRVLSQTAATIGRLVGTPAEGGGVTWLLIRVAVIVLLSAALAWLVRRLEAPLRRMAFEGAGEYGRRTRIMLAVANDAIRRVVPVVFLYALIEFWLRTDVLQQRLILRTLGIVVFWYLLTFPVETALRPRHPELRLARLGDAAAAAAAFHLNLILLAGIAVQNYLVMLERNGMEDNPVDLLSLLAGTAIAAWMFAAIRIVFRRQREEEPGARAAWPWVAAALVALLWVTWTIDVVNDEVAHFDALVWSIAVVASAWVVDATVGLAIGREVDPEARLHWWRDPGILRVVRRFVRVAAFVVIGALIVQTWIVDLLGVVSDERWARLKAGIMEAGFVVVIGYLSWEALRIFADRKLALSVPDVNAADAADQAVRSGSRFQTMLPVIRIFAGICIAIITALVALSQLGVNVAPLIAGASIFGLAISFGSQTLVRDIVSGIFFMADDAFRVGEYIDTGKLKGTVEGISIRSIKLRHQNGQIHTVPFGQIQSVTNFSRDWTTVKFNLRLARDTDIEKVRKLVKKIGAEMAEDPELKAELLQPLKLQGVADIADNAVVVRCKFTARPQKPSWIQREALKRIFRAFGANGIQFATPLNLQTLMAAVEPKIGPAPAG